MRVWSVTPGKLLRVFGTAFCGGFAGTMVGAAAVADKAPVPPLSGATTVAESYSPVLGRNIAYTVYLPPGYNASGPERYPVIYLLHGRGGSMTGWVRIMPHLEQMIAAGQIPPVIAVLPDAPSSHRAGYYIDSRFTGGGDLAAGEKIETAFTTDLIRAVDTRFRTQAERSGRVVAGYSMGGYGAMRYSLAHPDLFCAAIVLSPAVYFPLPPKDSSTRQFGAFGNGHTTFDPEVYTRNNYLATLPLFEARGLPLAMFIAAGDDEGGTADPADARHDIDLEAHVLYNQVRRVRTITSQLRIVDGGHNWDTWRPTFIEGLQFVFRHLKRGP